jgi:hypothetical protein
VLGQRLGGPPGHEGQAELVVGGAVAQVGHEVVGDTVAGDAPQGAVQAAVELRVAELVVLLDGLDHLREQCTELVPVGVGGPLGREPGDESLQHAAGLADLDGLGHADAAHGGAPVRLALHEALGVELDERGADRGPPHPVPVGELQLDQTLAGREGTTEDVVPQPVGHRQCGLHGPASLSAERRSTPDPAGSRPPGRTA